MVYSCVSIIFVSNLQTASWASELFRFTNLDVESVATAPAYVKTAVPLGISFCLLMIINPPNRDIESLFYYSSSKKELILDFMLEERDCLFPSLDKDLRLASFHGNQRVLMDPCGTFF